MDGIEGRTGLKPTPAYLKLLLAINKFWRFFFVLFFCFISLPLHTHVRTYKHTLHTKCTRRHWRWWRQWRPAVRPCAGRCGTVSNRWSKKKGSWHFDLRENISVFSRLCTSGLAAVNVGANKRCWKKKKEKKKKERKKEKVRGITKFEHIHKIIPNRLSFFFLFFSFEIRAPWSNPAVSEQEGREFQQLMSPLALLQPRASLWTAFLCYRVAIIKKKGNIDSDILIKRLNKMRCHHSESVFFCLSACIECSCVAHKNMQHTHSQTHHRHDNACRCGRPPESAPRRVLEDVRDDASEDVHRVEHCEEGEGCMLKKPDCSK